MGSECNLESSNDNVCHLFLTALDNGVHVDIIIVAPLPQGAKGKTKKGLRKTNGNNATRRGQLLQYKGVIREGSPEEENTVSLVTLG